MKSSRVFVLSVVVIFVIALALNSGLVFAEELKGKIKGSINARARARAQIQVTPLPDGHGTAVTFFQAMMPE